MCSSFLLPFLNTEFELVTSSTASSHDNTAKCLGVKVQLQNQSSNIITNSPATCMTASSTGESVSLGGGVADGADNPALNGDSATLRRKARSSRRSLPSALNNASDKLFGKRKSTDGILKTKTLSLADNEKKDKRTFKDLFGMRRSTSRDILKSVDNGLDSTGVAESPTNDGEPAVVGALTPTPSIGDIDDDSQLCIEPPSRSFPLSHAYLPHRFHGDMYDTAFALTSLQGDNSSDSGLQYLTKVHSVVQTAYLSTPPASASRSRSTSPSTTRPAAAAHSLVDEGILTVWLRSMVNVALAELLLLLLPTVGVLCCHLLLACFVSCLFHYGFAFPLSLVCWLTSLEWWS